MRSTPDLVLGHGERLIAFYGPFFPVSRPQESGVPLVKFPVFSNARRPFERASTFFFLEPDDLASFESWQPSEVEWGHSAADDLAIAFDEIQVSLRSGHVDKLVAGGVWRARYSGPRPSLFALLKVLVEGSQNLDGIYAFRSSDGLVVGRSPELFFDWEARGDLQSVALAGTQSVSRENELLSSAKDNVEHDYVVRHFSQCMEQLSARAKIGEKSLKRAGAISHLYTPLSSSGLEFSFENIERVFNHLHPTPALGVFPRTEQNLSFLKKKREAAKLPEFFGAPVACLLDDCFFSHVCIRGMWITDDELLVPTGCGIVAESVLENEKRELLLKRNAVCKNFALRT